MPQIRILTVSDNKEEWLTKFQTVYQKKINYFADVDVITLKPYREARDQVNEKKNRESQALLKKIEPKDYLILCDIKGKSFSSLEFAKKIEKLSENFASRKWVFVIGGAYGVNQELEERANERLNLSSMTMNHHLALAFLMEQIYRGFTIIKKIPYHNE